MTMDPMQIFWLFFMLTALQPVITQRLLEASRKRLIGRIERERKSRVILLVHRQETMSLLGFPIFRYIDVDDSEEVIRAIHLTDPEIPLDLVLHTPGGLVLAATQIARAVLKRKGKVTVFVPHYAMSGGTLIALAAKEIVMSGDAVLGPVDPQLRAAAGRFDSEGDTSETDRRGRRPDVDFARSGRKSLGSDGTRGGRVAGRQVPWREGPGLGQANDKRHMDARLPNYLRAGTRPWTARK